MFYKKKPKNIVFINISRPLNSNKVNTSIRKLKGAISFVLRAYLIKIHVLAPGEKGNEKNDKEHRSISRQLIPHVLFFSFTNTE
jgi:hypothetical protein